MFGWYEDFILDGGGILVGILVVTVRETAVDLEAGSGLALVGDVLPKLGWVVERVAGGKWAGISI